MSSAQLQKIMTENADRIKEKSDKKETTTTASHHVTSSGNKEEEMFDKRVDALFLELDNLQKRIEETKEACSQWDEDRKREAAEFDDSSEDEEKNSHKK